jgi:hypothetical protein
MKKLVAGILMYTGAVLMYSEGLSAKVGIKTDVYQDYAQTCRILTAEKNECVMIETAAQAHSEDDSYWGFDILGDKSSIRVIYKGTQGYIDFHNLKSMHNDCAAILHAYTDKVLVPVSYCDVLYRQDIKYIEDTDPFVAKYEQYIKYNFVDDIHRQWYFNYPVNYSFCNDVCFQFGSVPSRYYLTGFIVNAGKESFTCVIDSNFDQFSLYDNMAKYAVGDRYTFNYKKDGDYVSVFDGTEKIFDGVYIDKKTWKYMYYFITGKQNQAAYNTYFLPENRKKIIWPVHENGRCDYN